MVKSADFGVNDLGLDPKPQFTVRPGQTTLPLYDLNFYLLVLSNSEKFVKTPTIVDLSVSYCSYFGSLQ